MEPTATNLILLAAGLLFVGAISGIVAGLLGVGGGIVIVPVLFHLFTSLEIDEAVRMHMAVGTSLATIIVTSSLSWQAHRKRGAVDAALLRDWGPPIFVGVLIGTALAGYVRGPVLTGVFAVVALIVSAHMLFGNKDWRIATRLPTGAPKHAVAGGIGAFSAMMGIGGGTLSVPTLTLFGYPIHRAVGTAAAIGLIIAIPGTLGFLVAGIGAEGRPPGSIGYVNLIGVALILPTSINTVRFGVKLAHSMNTLHLRRAFAVFLGLTSARMFYSVLT